jgi:hypothetical protein
MNNWHCLAMIQQHFFIVTYLDRLHYPWYTQSMTYPLYNNINKGMTHSEEWQQADEWIPHGTDNAMN